MALKPARFRSGVALRARSGLTPSMIGLSRKPPAGFLTRNPKLKGIMWSHLTAEALSSAEAAEMETKKISLRMTHLPVSAFRSKNTQRTQRFPAFQRLTKCPNHLELRVSGLTPGPPIPHATAWNPEIDPSPTYQARIRDNSMTIRPRESVRMTSTPAPRNVGVPHTSSISSL